MEKNRMYKEAISIGIPDCAKRIIVFGKSDETRIDKIRIPSSVVLNSNKNEQNNQNCHCLYLIRLL